MRNWPLSRARSWVASRGDHMLGRPSFYWEREPKRRATVQLAVRSQFAAHTADDGVGQGEPQPCPSFFDDARIRAAEELGKQPGQIGFADANPRVRNHPFERIGLV